ncbi:MAG: AAA domain-containing protein [Candidatus Heimdallarchaeota archaeon]
MVSDKRDTLKHWHQAINHEQLANLKQSWHQAVPVTLASLKRKRRGYNVTVQVPTMPSWAKPGEWVSLGKHPSEMKLLEGKILEKNAATQVCILHVKQREIEKVMKYEREQWLLPFSTVPYNLMQERIEEVTKLAAPLPLSLLTKKTIIPKTLNVIQGPPGTGKTTAIGEMCLELFNQAKNQQTTHHNSPKILLTALTHKACVNLAEKLDELKVPFVAMKLRGLPNHLRAKYDLEQITERVLQQVSHQSTGNRKDRQKREIGRQIVEQIRFVITTAMAAPKRFVVGQKPPFEKVIIDEGSQLTLPVLSGVLSLGEDAIVFGDPVQLPPVVIAPHLGKARNFQVNPLTYTIYKKVPPQAIELLDTQYRGRPEIFLLVSSLFYQGRLRTGRYLPPFLDFPVVEFIDSSTSSPQEFNRVNYHEATICQSLLNELAANIPPDSPPVTVGIISPFRAQAAHLRRELQVPPSISLDIGTVHVAQGRTYDLVIISLAATTPSSFLNPPEPWLQRLKNALPSIFRRLKTEAHALTPLNYPDYTEALDHVYNRWHEQLAPFLKKERDTDASTSSFRLRLFEDAELDFVFDLETLPRLPENDFAPNILNVALSRARHRVVMLGHFDILHQNPLVNLIHSWAEVFGQVRAEPLSQTTSETKTNAPYSLIGDQWQQ